MIFRMAEFKNLKGVNTLLASRDLLKRKILRVFNYLQTGENLTKSLFQVEKERVTAWSKEIETLNSKIYDACVKADIDLTRVPTWKMRNRSQVTNLKSTVNWTKASTRSHIPTSRIVTVVKIRIRKETRLFLKYTLIFPPPRLQCPKISGRISNKFEF